MDTTKRRSLSKIFFFLLKLMIAAAVIGFLLRRRGAELLSALQDMPMHCLLPALFFYVAHMAASAWRWNRLTALLGRKMSLAESLSLTMQGYFFALVIPGGSIGGDVVRIGAVSKRSGKGNRVEGAFTVVMDRIIGMISLFLPALILTAAAIPFFLRIQVPGVENSIFLNWLLIVAFILLCIGGLTASCLIFFHRWLEKLPLIGRIIGWCDRKSSGAVSRMFAAADVYASRRSELLLLAAASSVFCHLMNAVPMILLLKGIGCSGFELTAVVAAVLIGNIAGLIPCSPGGIGLRDITVIVLLGAGGVSGNAAEISQLLYTAVLIAGNLLGGIFFIFDSKYGKNSGTEAESEAV